MKKLLVVSPPRSGSSVLSQLLESAGYHYPKIPLCTESEIRIAPSEFNPAGYNEDTALTLLNDQLIRLLYGQEYSFLYPPEESDITAALNKPIEGNKIDSFYYDLDESTVVFPRDYLSRLQEIANHSWDVWGLSRMRASGKWYKAYSRHNLASGADVYKRLLEFTSFLSSKDAPQNIYVKDPRIIFAFPAYVSALQSCNFAIIFINRDPLGLLISMRSHYGNRLFTDQCIDDLNYVSNHFNYQIQPQSFADYVAAINCAIVRLKELGVPVLDLSYDKIMKKEFRRDELARLVRFIDAEVDSSILHAPS